VSNPFHVKEINMFREEACTNKLMGRLIDLVDRVRSRELCGRPGCGKDWGEHLAQLCPDGEGEFQPIVKKEEKQ
jgi:hypothetical protein